LSILLYIREKKQKGILSSLDQCGTYPSLGTLNFSPTEFVKSHCVAGGKYKLGVYGIVLDFEISLVFF
jgi:hypothetical protein